MKYNSKEIKIGLTGIAALAILVFGLNYLKGINIFKTGDHYLVKFENVLGMPISSPIFADGVKVGSVRDIEYNRNQSKEITVKIEVDNGLRIPKGSRAEVETDMLGAVKITLLLANNMREKYQENDTIPGGINLGIINNTINQMTPQINSILPKLDSIANSLQQIVASQSIDKTLKSTEKTMKNLEQASAQLNLIMQHKMPNIAANLEQMSSNAVTITNNLKTVDFAKTIKSINTTLAHVEQTTKQLNKKNNTMGLLLNDSTLYTNLTTLSNSATKLLNDFKSHPKRYVHFSVFGRKEKQPNLE